MHINYKDKVVLIGGSTSGIGEASAKMFAENEASVILLGRDEQKLIDGLKSLKKNENQNHYYIKTDFEDSKNLENDIKAFFNNKNLYIDIIVNNIGGPLPKKLFEIDDEEFNQFYHRQFLSFHIITRILIERIKAKGKGRIINVIGTSVKSSISFLGLSAFKSAVLSWSKTLSEEIGQVGITVNNVLPGPTDTPELKKIITKYAQLRSEPIEQIYNSIKDETSLRRFANPDEIANVILFLASDYASYMNGSNLTVDGGYSKTLF